MARIICIANQKGGVGKTTTSVNLSSCLAARGRKVLLVDLDPQGNASSGLGLKKHEYQEANIYHVLIGEKTIDDIRMGTSNPNLFVAPATPDLVGAEIELVDAQRREYRLREAIGTVADGYDYVLIDCPPSLGLLTLNALAAANTFLVPLQCEYYALEGLSQLLTTAGLVKKNINPELRIEGILLTMFAASNNLSHQVVSEIQTHFGDKVFKAIIPRNVRLSEAPSHGQSILEYEPRSVGAIKYQELAQELDARVYGQVTNQTEGVEVEIGAQRAATNPNKDIYVEGPNV
jgi:chromosome partitioning protein